MEKRRTLTKGNEKKQIKKKRSYEKKERILKEKR
jgi:hypothetical protein